MADSSSSGSSGGSLIVAAIILALSIVTGSFILKSSLDQGGQKLAAVLGEIHELNGKLADAGGRPSAARPAARPPRPDPEKKYDVEIGNAPRRGPNSAPIKIVEWSDFQCPFCGRAEPTLAEIEKHYGDKVQVVFKHMPLSMHSKARPAHRAAAAAGKQGKFWQMHDLIFADQRDMSEAKYLEYAKKLGLNIDQFKKDMASPEVEKQINADYAQATKLGVTGTPAFFVNGRFLSGAQPYESFKALIDQELAEN